jgi:C-terminal processing protease CtpA/Prc
MSGTLNAEFDMLVRVVGKRTDDTTAQEVVDVLNWQIGTTSTLEAGRDIDPSRIEVKQVRTEPYRNPITRVAIALERIAAALETKGQS